MSSYSFLRRKLAKKTLYEMYQGRLPQIGAPGGTAGAGNVFFVNGSSGSNSNSGNQNSPFATITYALSKCTDRYDDTILVTRDTTEPEYPVVIEKRDVHILGWDEPTRLVGEKVLFNYDGTTAGFRVAAQNVEIAGFSLCAGDDDGCIVFGTGAYYAWWNCAIHDCLFGCHGTAQDGVRLLGSGDAPYLHVYDCYFGEGLSRDGVRITGTMTRGWIGYPGHGNIFRDVAALGIHVPTTSTAQVGGMADNVFRMVSDTAGYAISFLNAGSGDCMVFNNQAFYGKAALTTNPYRDLGSNHWGLNYKQDVSVMPAII